MPTWSGHHWYPGVFGSWWAKGLPTTCMKLNTHLKSTSIAHVSGHCVEIYVNTKSQFYFGLHRCHYRDHHLLLWDMVWHWLHRIQNHVHRLHSLDNNAFDDDERLDWVTNGEGIVDIGGFISPGDDISTLDDVKVLEAKTSNALMEWVMAQLMESMRNIMKECIEGGVAFCIHATSLFKVVCANVHTNCLIKGYESLHLGIIFN